MRKIITISTLPLSKFNETIKGITIPLMRRYAERVDAKFQVLEKHIGPNIGKISFEKAMDFKMDAIQNALDSCDEVLYLDSDVLVNPNSPDIFSCHPLCDYGAVNEIDFFDTILKLEESDPIIFERHQDVVKSCLEENLRIPDTRGIYYNCGVQLIRRKARSIFNPRVKVGPSFCTWSEQSLVNARVHLQRDSGDICSAVLPNCWNFFAGYGGKSYPGNYLMGNYFIHYCGMDPNSRLDQIKKDFIDKRFLGL